MKKTTKKQPAKASTPEFAFYYPGVIWTSDNWIKNLILFFDGIALLVPNYMKERPHILDPAIATPLESSGLLKILEPEKLVDAGVTELLTNTLKALIDAGVFDNLAKQKIVFHELSQSRLGFMGNEKLAEAVFKQLKEKGLAKDSQDHVSIPMHPVVRTVILVLLAHLLRPKGQELQIELSPATDNEALVSALEELLASPGLPSAGRVVSSDMEAVGVDLRAVPLDEILSFRRDNFTAHRRYVRAVRKFVSDLGPLSQKDRDRAMTNRLQELQDYAADLKKASRKAWKKPASFLLSITGAAFSMGSSGTARIVSGALGAIAPLFGIGSSSDSVPEAYSYLFKARSRYPY